MRRADIARYAASGMKILTRAEDFWEHVDAPTSIQELLRYSALLGLLPFAGFLMYYTLFGHIWNWWPFVRTDLPVLRGFMCAGLQWVFFLTFPLLSALLLDVFLPTHHSGPEFHARILITTYAMTPLFIGSLFVGVPFMNQGVVVLAFSTFVYLNYYGYRIYSKKGIIRSAIVTLLTTLLFTLIRQMFVFVIGF